MSDADLRETLLRSRLTIAMIEALQRAWPTPLDIVPSALDSGDEPADTAFLDAIHGLVDEGLVMIEALLVGTAAEPLAKGAVLTRRGATVLYNVTRPM